MRRDERETNPKEPRLAARADDVNVQSGRADRIMDIYYHILLLLFNIR